MELKPGQRLRSKVCATEVIIVRPPQTPVELGCGGESLVAAETERSDNQRSGPRSGLDGGNLLGKRYTTTVPSGLELLVVKAGAGTLTGDGEPLVQKEAKPLPASD
jgi:hypothetical protein